MPFVNLVLLKNCFDLQEKTGEAPETMTQKDAMMFPVIASCALFSLYIFFQVAISYNIPPPVRNCDFEAFYPVFMQFFSLLDRYELSHLTTCSLNSSK